MPANPIPRLTATKYLAMEEAATFKSEFLGGEVFAMAGASYAHVVLVGNLFGELRDGLRGKPCRAVSSDLLFRVGSGRLFAYPDVMVFCGPVEFAGDGQRVALNPIVVAEVLSPSTERFDRGRKAAEYRKCESVQQYVLVSQDEAMVEIYTREPDGLWRLSEVEGLDGVVALSSLGVEVLMRALYEGVELDGAAS